MDLPRARKALNQALARFANLEGDANDPEAFRDNFVDCCAMIRRVGSILDHETVGHRTAAFSEFWRETGEDPRFEFVSDVRNAEFKRGEDRKRALHQLQLNATGVGQVSLVMEVIRQGEVAERYAYSDPPKPAQSPPESVRSVTWFFTGGTYDGQEVLGFLRAYLQWLQDTIMPTAERVTNA